MSVCSHKRTKFDEVNESYWKGWRSERKRTGRIISAVKWRRGFVVLDVAFGERETGLVYIVHCIAACSSSL